MNLDLATTMQERYAEVSCHGIYSKRRLLEALDRSLDIGEAKGVGMVLVDLRGVLLKGPPPNTIERYQIGEEAARIQLSHKKLVVLAVVGDVPMIDPDRFSELVARNRGAHGKVFDDMGEATVWVQNMTSSEDLA